MPIHSNLEIPESELLAWYFNIAELQKDFIKNFGAGIDRLEGVIRSMQKFLPQEISPQ